MSDQPPSYEHATGNSNSNPNSRFRSDFTPHLASSPSFLDVPRNDIPILHRRSMEDEGRPLPQGWIRQFDAKEKHQFFVDTRADPPRSIWQHPHDDADYLASLTAEQREALQAAESHPSLSAHVNGRRISKADLAAESSAEDSDHDHNHATAANLDGKSPNTLPTSAPPAMTHAPDPALPPRNPEPKAKGVHKLARSMKDSLLGSTHAEREVLRAQRAEEERQAYAQYVHLRDAMARAQHTGEPQLLGVDRDGKQVYMQPPNVGMGMGTGYGYGGGGYGPGGGHGGFGGQGGYGFNPYQQGAYADPNKRFVEYPRPGYAYGRPGGGGYGGGMGLPLMGGLMGGALLGGLLF